MVDGYPKHQLTSGVSHYLVSIFLLVVQDFATQYIKNQDIYPDIKILIAASYCFFIQVSKQKIGQLQHQILPGTPSVPRDRALRSWWRSRFRRPSAASALQQLVATTVKRSHGGCHSGVASGKKPVKCVDSWCEGWQYLSGWWLTYPSEKYERQVGWWNSQYMGK